jgi:hypothetical protein
MSNNTLVLQLGKRFFWDMDIAKMDDQLHKRIIIERVMTIGDMEELKKIKSFYGIEVIKEEVKQAGFLDKKTLNWLSLVLKIPKTQFRCYLKMQSRDVHWNF